MHKLMKRRFRPYLHPTGMEVRGYQDENWPPPPPNASAPADNTRYVNPSPPYQPLVNIPNDQVHNNAVYGIAMATALAAARGASTGMAAGPEGAALNAVKEGCITAATGILTVCGTCHRR
jgi:hypothetical protein